MLHSEYMGFFSFGLPGKPKKFKTWKDKQAHIARERDPKKRREVLIKKGFKRGRLSEGFELHHHLAVAEGGKTTTSNTYVVSKKTHKKIHRDRKKWGRV